MQIKRITSAEYNLVIALFNDYRVFYKQEPDMAVAENYIKARLQNNESVIFVALVDVDGAETPAGFTQLYPRLSSVRATKNWLLNDLYVDANFRRQGIGEALIKTAMDFAKNDGATFIKLETAIDNYTAQSLYEAIGFIKQEAGTSSFTYQAELK
jgi:ribosomal protein S18 acetylase RimI-like enzyme